MSLRGNVKYFKPRANVRGLAPAVEPVTLADMKTHLRVTDDDATLEDYITNLIIDARVEFEDRTNLALIDQSHTLLLDCWDAKPEPWWDGVREMAVTELNSSPYKTFIEFPVYPLKSDTSAGVTVTVYDESGNSTLVDVDATFDIDKFSNPCRMSLKVGATWPIATRSLNAISISYQTGFGAAASAIPTPLIRAVKNMVSFMYDNRGDGCSSADAFHKSGADNIARIYRRAHL